MEWIEKSLTQDRIVVQKTIFYFKLLNSRITVQQSNLAFLLNPLNIYHERSTVINILRRA